MQQVLLPLLRRALCVTLHNLDHVGVADLLADNHQVVKRHNVQGKALLDGLRHDVVVGRTRRFNRLKQTRSVTLRLILKQILPESLLKCHKGK